MIAIHEVSPPPINLEYDPGVVVKKGEDHFFDCDNYAAQFFLNDLDKNPWKPSISNPAVLTLAPEHFNPNLIRRFCMTVLWRGHTTTQSFFSNVDIGPHEERLRQMIMEGEVVDLQDFSVILYGWLDVPRPWPLMAPEDVNIGSCDFIRFTTDGMVFAIKVDSKPFPAEGLASVVGGAPELATLQIPFVPSKSARELVERIDQKNEERSSHDSGKS